MRRAFVISSLCALALLAAGCGDRDEGEAEEMDNTAMGTATMDPGMPTTTTPMEATAMIQPTGTNQVTGQATFREAPAGGIEVSVQLANLTAGEHGIHIHEKGDCGNDAKNAGDHWNPMQAKHGMQGQGQAHLGDMGNITADATGNATLTFTIPGATLGAGTGMGTTGTTATGTTTGTTTTTTGTTGGSTPGHEGHDMTVVGKAIVVHAKADDLKTDPSGNSGDRIACGVITMGTGTGMGTTGTTTGTGTAGETPGSK